jgi:hypothetical protein
MRLYRFVEALRHRVRPTAPPTPVPAAAGPPPTVDAFARSALEKAEHKLVELDWRLRAVEAERDTHARSRPVGRP